MIGGDCIRLLGASFFLCISLSAAAQKVAVEAGDGQASVAPYSLAGPGVPTCTAGVLLGNEACILPAGASVCPPGSLALVDGSCIRIGYWSALVGVHGPQGRPLLDAFVHAGVAKRRKKRSKRSHLVGGASETALLAGIGGLAAGADYAHVARPAAGDGYAAAIVSVYAGLGSEDFLGLPASNGFSHFGGSAGIANRLEDGAWMVTGTGDGKFADVVNVDGSGKVHFFYGLNEGLDGRHEKSADCSVGGHVIRNCIGVPHAYVVEGSDGSRVEHGGAGSAATFGFAAYLLTWERMAKTAGISSVFDLARVCTRDLGTPGVDAQTGLGRLDIGCMAYGAAHDECRTQGLVHSSRGLFRCSKGTNYYRKHPVDSLNDDGSGSPLLAAFKDVGAVARKFDRNSHVYLIDSDLNNHGNAIMTVMAALGVHAGGKNYRYLDFTGYAFEDGIRRHYLSLTDSDVVNTSLSHDYFFDYGNDQAIFRSHADLASGAWLIKSAGNVRAGRTYKRSPDAHNAAATGKVHFYYGLEEGRGYDARHEGSIDCRLVESACIGMPFHYEVYFPAAQKIRSYDGTSFSAPFALATYLMAWERMPARTHISAVFDMARNHCVEDLGEPGPDTETGLGRLDIGCMAYGATQAPECQHGYELVAVWRCAPLDYWDDMRPHVRLPGGHSVLTRAFADAGLAERQADRSANAHLIASQDVIDKLAGRMGIASSVNYRPAIRPEESSEQFVVKTHRSLGENDFVGVPEFVGFTTTKGRKGEIKRRSVASGAWMVMGLRARGSVNPAGGNESFKGMKGAGKTGKVHFFYGLAGDLGGRDSASDGCQHIEGHCLGAPRYYYVDLNRYSSAAAPAAFGFASYLLTWERLPKGTGIGTVFDMALNCTEDLGIAGPDAETGRGRLDIGCMAQSARRFNAAFSECSKSSLAFAGLVAGRPSCRSHEDQFRQMDGHIHNAGKESPYRKAFRLAGATGSGVDRSGHAHVYGTPQLGAISRRLLAHAGVRDNDYTYTQLAGGKQWDDALAGSIRDFGSGSQASRDSFHHARNLDYGSLIGLVQRYAAGYRLLTASELVQFSGESFYSEDAAGVTIEDLKRGAWAVHDTGVKRGEDDASVPDGRFASLRAERKKVRRQGRDDEAVQLTQLAQQVRQGIRAAAATGKVHFYYGLSSSAEGALSHRSSALLGCRGIEGHCIGVQAEIAITLQDGSETRRGLGNSSELAFAAYLLAWERMPQGAHISAVFDLARGCVQDLGDPGADADTGLGRLDIGCMAHGALQAPECQPEYRLVSMSSCERLSYWEDMQPHVRLRGRDGVLGRAFADLGLQDSEPRSSHLIAEDALVDDVISRLGISGYIYWGRKAVNASVFVDKFKGVSTASLVGVPQFAAFLSGSGDAAAIDADAVQGKDLWLAVGLRDRGLENPLNGMSADGRKGTKALAATGRVHFFYGLNEELDGRDAGSDGCKHLEDHCLGTPKRYYARVSEATSDSGAGYASYSSSAAAASFGFASYLLAWQRMPEKTGIDEVFALARSCAQDLGASGADADTGLGRLDIGCMAYGAYQAHNPQLVPTPAAAGSRPDQLDDPELEGYMSNFARGLFGNQLGFLSLPGTTPAFVKVGFAGDSFRGVYRPVENAGAYRPGRIDPHYLPSQSAFGLLVDSSGRAGVHYRLSDQARAGISMGRRESFFGATGSGEFAFGCTRELSLLVSRSVAVDEHSRLQLDGWLNESRVGCITGSLLDSLQGREAGVTAGYGFRRDGWQVDAQVWGSRFLGGEVGMAGSEFSIDSGEFSYGGRLQVSYDF